MFKLESDTKPLKLEICNEENFSINETEPCEEYIYDNTYFDETVATKFGLVCDNESYRNLLGTVLILGLLVGSLVGGTLGDKFGRKKAIFSAIALTIPLTVGSCYVNSYNAFIVLHFITACCLPVLWINASVYQDEIVEPKWRLLKIVLDGFILSSLVFGLIVYYNRTWRGIHFCCSIISAVTMLFWFLVPESPRWLAQNGKDDEAIKVLLHVAKMNGRKLSSEDEIKMRDLVLKMANDFHATDNKLTILDMFSHGQVTKTLILLLAWIATCTSNYAIKLNSSDLNGNIIINFMIARTISIFSAVYILLTANYFGRRYTLSFAHLIVGSSCLAMGFIPKDYSSVILVFYLVSTVFVGASFNLIYLMTSELYPTNLRSQAVGFSSMVSRAFCACAPFLGHLAKVWEPAPMVIIGVPLLICGLFVLRLPETLNKELPQTICKTNEENNIRS